jgi:Phosphoenolpyruvate-dependent sugar phosphotransferase system, EIIA 2
LGQGVALPHARIKDLPQAVAAFVRLKLPIPFDAPDAKPVSDMVILFVPEHATA